MSKTALITGSSRRVGLDIGRQLVDAGWTVILHGRNEERSLNAKQQVHARGVVVGDLEDPNTYTGFLQAVETISDTGGLDLLVNCASTFERDGKTPWEAWNHFEAAMQEVRWAYMATHCLAEVMETRRNPLVINLTDYSSQENWKGYISHGLSKAALETMSYDMNTSWKRAGVKRRMACLRLPTVLLPDGMSPEQSDRVLGKYGESLPVESVGKAVLELVSRPGFNHGVWELHGPEGEIR